MVGSRSESVARDSDKHVPSSVDRSNLTVTPSPYKRAYKACEACRKTKAKCELEPSATACSKCLREQKECVFPPHRSMKRAKISAEQTASGETDKAILGHNGVHAQKAQATPHVNFVVATPSENTTTSLSNPPRHSSLQAITVARSSNPPPKGNATAEVIRSTSSLQQNSEVGSSDQHQDHLPLLIAEAGQPDDLQRDVMQTFVTNSKDAIGLLFRAAEQIDSEDSDEQHGDPDPPNDGSAAAGSIYNIQSPSMPSPGLASSETLDLWDQHRFVRQGWFTAREAVAYLEFFFRHLSPLSPVADSYYADHRNHKKLILEEPLLCCTLLMIASRHHILASGIASRADFIHMRLWKHVEHLIQKITFGSEKYSIGKTRTLGSIQALLLIIEWHPRALHFPPETDGWDSSLAPSVDDTFAQSSRRTDAGKRWREDVFEPAKRSDRMSWMLVGIAITLAHELGVFDHPDDDDAEPGFVAKRKTVLRTRRLLFLYASQLSLRLGCTNVYPQVHHQTVTYNPESDGISEEQVNVDREIMISKWIEITKLLTTATEMFFGSPSATRQMLRSSRYVSLLDHFQPLLARWYNDYTKMACPSVAEPARQILLVEYYYVRMYINSIAMQALVERASGYNSGDIWLDQDFLRSEFAQDFRFVKEVREASTDILSIATKLAEKEILQYCPVRVFLRVVSASIFLLKTISLGTREADMVKSLGQLEQCIEALQTSRADDVHLSSRYAMLIARHVRRFKRNFRIKKPGAQHPVQLRIDVPLSHTVNSGAGLATLPGTIPEDSTTQQQQYNVTASSGEYDAERLDPMTSNTSMPFFDFEDGGTMQDWLAQPFNSQVAPFGTDWLQPSTGLAIDSLDFLWNMST